MSSIPIVKEKLKNAFSVYRLSSLYFYFSFIYLIIAAAAMKDYSVFLCFIKRNLMSLYGTTDSNFKPKKDVILKKMKFLEFII
jgi:hypothetical protein